MGVQARVQLPEPVSYRLKCWLLGPPLTSDRLRREQLSNPVALGVLSPDCISSTAYGTEETLLELLPFAGLAAFTLLLPITGVILLILLLMTLSYRQVLAVYTKAGGAYVVTRDNFGPRVAQIAAVALLIDYVVTVAVQTAAGTVAVASALPALGPYTVTISVSVVVLLCYGNLRGVREAGRLFAFPTYFFIAAITAVIVIGIVRSALGNLPTVDPEHHPGIVPVAQASGWVMGASALVVLRAFANGGSSLTGLEAISNGVSVFRPPRGRNAQRVLALMAAALAFLLAGVAWLAHLTHTAPYRSGYPSVISQQAHLVLGTGAIGTVGYALVQAASALILYTGANTSFNGFPFLASFVAEDSFLPRQLTRRGHRLVFSNGILLLAAVSIALLIATDAKVNALIPLYAIGVFTGFAMAGFGMAHHHLRTRPARWHPKLAINLAAGALSTLVVGILAVAKFSEGAWLVVVLFPLLTLALIRINHRYRAEAAAMGTITPAALQLPHHPEHVVLILVDHLDLATLRAFRYARSLRPTQIRAAHFVLDSAHAHALETGWQHLEGLNIDLEVIECPDRRLTRCAQQLIAETVADPDTELSVLLPRRITSPLIGRLLHDRTADRIAAAVTDLPRVAATIIPADPTLPVRPTPSAPEHARPQPLPPATDPGDTPDMTVPIGAAHEGQLVRVQGRIHAIDIRPTPQPPLLECTLTDDSGALQLLFYGRRDIPGIQPGVHLRAEGRITHHDHGPTIINPRYELLSPDTPG
jgi:amino acid transporter